MDSDSDHLPDVRSPRFMAGIPNTQVILQPSGVAIHPMQGPPPAGYFGYYPAPPVTNSYPYGQSDLKPSDARADCRTSEIEADKRHDATRSLVRGLRRQDPEDQPLGTSSFKLQVSLLHMILSNNSKV
ncbi:hypothetical protein C8J56DRAFT_897259 [Mycena floridula]|nr:hypothetical protein C8J56DRAFT_897259 [Mycena floridula]